MGDTANDPIDHSRTTRQHAGETMKNGANAPGLISIGIGIAAMVIGLAAFATGNAAAGWIAVLVAAVLGVIGAAWLFVAHRKVREREILWARGDSDAVVPPPTS